VTKYRLPLLTALILLVVSCVNAQSNQVSTYIYADLFDTLLPLQRNTEQLKVSLSETESFRLAVLNKNIRLSLNDSVDICGLKKLNALQKISKNCSSVILYSIDQDLLSSVEKAELSIYRENYEFNHLSGRMLKEATIYDKGVLFEYDEGDGLSTYYYKKELGNSKTFQYSMFNAPIELFEDKNFKNGSKNIDEIAFYIASFLNNKLSINEFMGLDLGIRVKSVDY